jgi:methionine aminopeptidase
MPVSEPIRTACWSEAEKLDHYYQRITRGNASKVEDELEQLRQKALLEEYPPLVEKRGVRVARFEHAILIHEDRAEVLALSPEDA